MKYNTFYTKHSTHTLLRKPLTFFYMNKEIEILDQDSVVGTKTHYGLDRPGIESRCGEIFCTHPDWT
jgi:hypothetical protein